MLVCNLIKDALPSLSVTRHHVPNGQMVYISVGNLKKKDKSGIRTKFESVSVRIFESETMQSDGTCVTVSTTGGGYGINGKR